ncbi:hypothetical protein C8R44DRAFT_740012 [Mycena epipterygia]|nr:hypothetical protein C8R44DRAFT_740012 [Mycena epipterygia]
MPRFNSAEIVHTDAAQGRRSGGAYAPVSTTTLVVSMALDIVAFTFDCPRNPNDVPGQILKMTAKRYRAPQSLPASSCHSEGLTLLFAHGTGGHKEQWEPIMSYIFATHGIRIEHSNSCFRSFSPHAGKTHRANWALSRSRNTYFLTARRASAFTMKDMDIASIPYVAFILIEASAANREIFERAIFYRLEALAREIKTRRDRWKSREEAYQWMKTKSVEVLGPACATYIHRIWLPQLELRGLPKSLSPQEYALTDTPTGEVKLKCDLHQEAMAYSDLEAHFIALDQIRRLHAIIPFYFVWAAQSEVVYDRQS